MANVKITDLAAYIDPVSTDVLPIVDVGNDLTKKVSIADLLENAGTGSAGAPSFSFDGDNDTGIYRPGANQLAISTNGTERLFVDSTGNVGIGASSPQGLLHLKSTTAEVLQIMETSTGTVKLYANNDDFIVDADQYRFRSEDGSTEYLRIKANGNVGIGTTDPQGQLTVAGNGSLYDATLLLNAEPSVDSAPAMIRMVGNNSTTPFTPSQIVELEAYQPLLGGTQDAALGLNVRKQGDAYDAPNRVVTFLGNGNTGFGTSNPGHTLDVVSTDGTVGVTSTTETNSARINIKGGTSSYAGINFGDSDALTIGYARYYNSDDSLRFQTNGSEKVRIKSDGVVTVEEGFITLKGNKLGAVKVEIDDDSFAIITPPRVGCGYVTVVEGGDEQYPNTNCRGFLYADWNSSPAVTGINLGGSFEVSTGGEPNGDTGTLGTATLFSGGTAGELYLENRLGSAGIFFINFI